jgi:hypothetical protein
MSENDFERDLMRSRWSVAMVPVERILPNEEYDARRLVEVLDSIERAGRWTVPIVLERASLAVMDGHHRLAAARALSFVRVPCVLLDYADVQVESRRPGIHVDGDEIIARSRARNLYPPKTTRHVFSRPLPMCSIALDLLVDTAPALACAGRGGQRAAPTRREVDASR